MEDFQEPSIADDKNSALILCRAAAAITNREDSEIQVPDEAVHDGWVQSNQAALTLVRQARRLPDANWAMVDRNHEQPQFNRDAFHKLEELLLLAMDYAGRSGDVRSFVEYLRDAMGIHRILSTGPVPDYQEEALAAEEQVVAAINQYGKTLWPVLRDPIRRQAVAELIPEFLDDTPVERTVQRLVQRRRVMFLHRLDQPAPMDASASDNSAWNRKFDDGVRFVFRIYSIRRQRDVLRSLDELDSALLKPSFTLANRELSGVSPVGIGIDAVDQWNNAMVEHNNAWSDLCMLWGSVARRRMAAIALAIRLYQSDHVGQLPGTLEALVPHYLSSVPLDPFASTASPIQLMTQPYRLYCVHLSDFTLRAPFNESFSF
jgi:hypothetical protein